MKLDPAVVIVALLGAGGIGAFVKDLFEVVFKLRSGVSARETKRRIDVVQQRDEAYARETQERDRADREARNSQRLQITVTKLQMQLIRHGIPETDIVQMPDLEHTVEREKVRRHVEKEKP